MRPAFFFDRDGVVNRSPGDGYVLRREDFHFHDGIFGSLAFLRSRGFALVLITSQQGVGKGLMKPETLDEIHEFMQAGLARQGAAFDAIYACTCLAEDPELQLPQAFAGNDFARGFRKHDLDLTESWLVGDHDRDILMARNAGVPHTIRIRGHRSLEVSADHVLDEVIELLPFLRERFIESR